MKNSRFLKMGSLLVLSVSVMVLFQNCGSGPNATSASSTSTNGTNTGTTTPPPPVVCPVTSNAVPAVTSVSSSTVSFNIGMGLDAGTESPKSITAGYSSGDTQSAVIAVNCTVPRNSGITVNCTLPNSTSRSGTMNIRISAANGAECLNGPVTVGIEVDDAIVNAQGAPIGACNNLARTSAVQNFTVNLQNSCLATQRVNPTNPYDAGQMGRTVAIDADWAVAVAPGDEEIGVDAGAAYVMRRSGTTWSITQKLIPSTLASGNLLTGAALSGNLLALGAPLANGGQGTVWLYQYNGSQWVEVKTLAPPANGGGLFGSALAISSSNVAVGAPRANLGGGTFSGAVYVFSGSGWNTGTVLTPSGGTVARGEFGTSLAYSGATLAVGAPFPSSVTTREEAIYIFNSLVLAQKIGNPRNVANAADRFGFALSLDGTNLLAGAPYNTNERGIAYLFRSTNGTFSATPALQYVLRDPNNNDVDHFGYSVAIKGTRVLVGAPDKAESAPKFGAVYLFGANANTQLYKIRSPTNDRDADSFGYSIGVSVDGWLISGALNDEHTTTVSNSGSVYFIDLP